MDIQEGPAERPRWADLVEDEVTEDHDAVDRAAEAAAALQATLSRIDASDLQDSVDEVFLRLVRNWRAEEPPPSSDCCFMRRLMTVDIAGMLLEALQRAAADGTLGPGDPRWSQVASGITAVLDAMAASAADPGLAPPLARCYRRMRAEWSASPRRLSGFMQAFSELALEVG